MVCVHEFAAPFRRGFHCNDETIRYPHKESTVSSGVCYLAGTSLNLILILILEYLLLVEQDDGNVQGFNAKIYMRNVYCRFLIWLLGGITSEFLTDISKYTAGRLRPHFIDVCKPRITLADSMEVSVDEYCDKYAFKYEYITNYRCSGRPEAQRDARLSFMSGHSSWSAYSAAHAVVSTK